MRALVVGLGRMGTFHRRVLHDLGYEVDAVDPRVGTDARFRTVGEAVVGRRRYDVACVAAPAEHLLDCAFQLAGTRMLVEKPFATNEREAAMLAAYLERAGAPVAVGFVERFNPRVRELRERLVSLSAQRATFTRWSDRPCEDLALDLLTHDVDLARHLHLRAGDQMPYDRLTFDTRADQGAKVRRIEVEVAGEWLLTDTGRPTGARTTETITADLMDHTQSPLHALWHAFLTDDPDVPRPADAVRAIREARWIVEQRAIAEAA